MDEMGILILVVVGSLLVGMRLVAASKAKQDAAAAKAYADAAQLGIHNEVVQHSTPFFSNGNRDVKLVDGSVTRFSMARTGGAAADDWAFLMRPADGRELYGDAYIFDSKAGAPPARLASTLRELAEELGDDSGYVEFEANGATVAAYCDTDDVGIHQRIIQWLPRLSRF